MKHGKNPSKKQKMFLKESKLNPENWLIVKDYHECFEIVHRVTGKRRKLKGRNEREVRRYERK